MKLFSTILVLSIFLLLSLGCTHTLTRTQVGQIKEAVREAQREAIGDIDRPFVISTALQGARYVWRHPVIEYVTMPPMIVDGVYIQGGKTPVVVRTGYFELVREEKATENSREERSKK